MNKQSAKERFKAVRRKMREDGDYTFESLERGREYEYEQEYEQERLRSYRDARVPGSDDPDWTPSRSVRKAGFVLLFLILTGSGFIMASFIGWGMTILYWVSMIVILLVAALPTLVELMIRGNRVIKHDRSRFVFGPWW